MGIALKYAYFAVLATGANIAAQDITISVYASRHGLLVSVLAGTLVGLVVKYVLDKRYIFNYRASGLLHDARLFVLYTMMGILTTAIFWGFEFAFHALFMTKAMRYLGAVIGLALGYWIKYRLDKHFVFTGTAE